MEKDELLRKIAEKELQFFLKLNAKNPECKKEDTFKFMRIARFYPYSFLTLSSYFQDLEKYERERKNPLWEKYRCMEGKISIPQEKMEILRKIVDIETLWILELHKKYPHAIQSKDEDFQRYLMCELSTFSLNTLVFYLSDIEHAMEEGRNLAYESYLYTFTNLGYSSLDEVEEKMREKSR